MLLLGLIGLRLATAQETTSSTELEPVPPAAVQQSNDPAAEPEDSAPPTEPTPPDTPLQPEIAPQEPPGATAQPTTPTEILVQESGGADAPVYIVPVTGEFENALHLILVRAIREAERAGAQALILDMDTPGGRVDSAIKIRDALIRTKLRTITYVNPMAVSAGSFIAVATDRIIMGPNGSIGGALPITVTEEGARGADEKFKSVFAAEMRKTAKTKGHPVEIAEGFCNPDLVIEGLKQSGQILTLDFEQAVRTGLSPYQADSLDAMLEREGLAGAPRVHVTEKPLDKVARFLSSTAISGLLIVLGISCLFIELKAPGLGLPGALGVLFIATYFLGSYLANLSSAIEWILFAIGIMLLIVEIYLIPGFGVIGIAGICCVLGSLALALISHPPDGGWSDLFNPARVKLMTDAGLTVLVAFLAMIPVLLILSRLLPATPMFRSLILDPAGAPGLQEMPAPVPTAAPAHAALNPGDSGTAQTDLRPGGVATFGSRRYDVTSQGELIERGAAVSVLRVEGTRIIVIRQA